MTKAGCLSRPLSNGEEQAPHSGSVIVIMFGWRSTCANPLARQLFHQNSPDRMLYAPGPDCVIAGKPWNHSARPGLRDIFIHRPADRPGKVTLQGRLGSQATRRFLRGCTRALDGSRLALGDLGHRVYFPGASNFVVLSPHQPVFVVL